MFTIQSALQHAIDQLLCSKDEIEKFYEEVDDQSKYQYYLTENNNEIGFDQHVCYSSIDSRVVGFVTFSYTPSTFELTFMLSKSLELPEDLLSNLKEYALTRSSLYECKLKITQLHLK